MNVPAASNSSNGGAARAFSSGAQRSRALQHPYVILGVDRDAGDLPELPVVRNRRPCGSTVNEGASRGRCRPSLCRDASTRVASIDGDESQRRGTSSHDAVLFPRRMDASVKASEARYLPARSKPTDEYDEPAPGAIRQAIAWRAADACGLPAAHAGGEAHLALKLRRQRAHHLQAGHGHDLADQRHHDVRLAVHDAGGGARRALLGVRLPRHLRGDAQLLHHLLDERPAGAVAGPGHRRGAEQRLAHGVRRANVRRGAFCRTPTPMRVFATIVFDAGSSFLSDTMASMASSVITAMSNGCPFAAVARSPLEVPNSASQAKPVCVSHARLHRDQRRLHAVRHQQAHPPLLGRHGDGPTCQHASRHQRDQVTTND